MSFTSGLNGTAGDEATDSLGHPRSWVVFVVSFALSLAAMLAWTLATPISGVPDEPAHFARAFAVAHGQLDAGPLPSTPWQSSADVPNYIAHTGQITCFAFHADVSAACQQPVSGNPNKMILVGQTAQSNSPLFYALVGLPTLVLSGDTALYAMRGVNAVLCALMVGFTFLSVSQLGRSRFALLATFVAITPMLLFLGGSVNPNALEVTAAVSLFAALTAIFSRARSRPQLVVGLGVVTVSTVLLTGTRSISLLWVLIALVAAFLLGKNAVISRVARTPIVWIATAVCVLVCAAELLWFVRPATTAMMPPFSGVGTSPIVAFAQMLVTTLDYASGWIGLFGWVDTPAPAITMAAWTLAISAVVIPAYFVARGRARWAIVVLGAAFVLTPALSQAAVIATSGYIWQGRYTLALLAMLLVGCGVCLDRGEFAAFTSFAPFARKLLFTVLIAMAVGQLAAFLTTLRRYVIGAVNPLNLMITHPAWQPPFGWIALTIVFTLTITLSTILIVRTVVTSSPSKPHRTPSLANLTR